MTTTGTNRKPSRVKIADAGDSIRRRETFTAGDGSLTGTHERLPRVDTGYLRDADRQDYQLAQDQHGAELYVVRSYGTPIAWAGPGEALTVPAVSYSATTSRHQGIARRADAAR